MIAVESKTMSRALLVLKKPGVPSAIIGCLVGLWFVGVKNILPWNIDWLTNKSDGSFDQLSFEFFRETPLVQWPLTALPNYLVGASQVLGSGNGLVAIPAKFIGKLVPGSFQYLGTWILSCFILQGYFAEKILAKVTSWRVLQVLGSLLFIFSPTLLYRVGTFRHFQLGAHWLILASILFYFDKDFRRKKWSLLLVLSVFINLYLTAMVLASFVAKIIKMLVNKSEGEDRIRRADLAIPFLYTTLAFILMGYASYGESSKGTGFFRLSPISFLNPRDTFHVSFSSSLSAIRNVPIQNFLSEEPEGFQFLGSGVIIGIGILLAFGHRIITARWIRLIGPLLVAYVLMFIFAMSNRISIFGNDFVYWWPKPLDSLREVFRATSRFGWPLYYLIISSVFILARLKISKRVLLLMFTMIIGFGLLDGWSGVLVARRDLISEQKFDSSLTSKQWLDLAENHDQIFIYPNFDIQTSIGFPGGGIWEERWFDLAKFAVDNKMRTNFGGTPRPITSYVENEDRRISSNFKDGTLDPRTIYVFANSSDWVKFKSYSQDNVDAFIVDGLCVIATRD